MLLLKVDKSKKTYKLKPGSLISIEIPISTHGLALSSYTGTGILKVMVGGARE